MGIAKLLIANGADVNAKSDRGRTPLHNAARWVHMEIAEMDGVSTETVEQDGDRKIRIFADGGEGMGAEA